MLRRSLLIAGIGLLPVLAVSRNAHAQLAINEAKAAIPSLATPSLAPAFPGRVMGDDDLQRISSLILRAGYRLLGDVRRKGQMFTMIAERDGASWRLVVDGVSGEMIGRKMVAYPVNLPE